MARWADGQMTMWPCGHMAIWPSGHLAIWPHGHMATWPDGQMGRLEPVFIQIGFGIIKASKLSKYFFCEQIYNRYNAKKVLDFPDIFPFPLENVPLLKQGLKVLSGCK